MPLDPSLVGHETSPQSDVISATAVQQFADAVGDSSPIYRDVDAARAAGYTTIPAPPTFVTRFIVPFAEAGLDTEHAQVLHGEQEYVYERPIGVDDAVTVRHRVASIRQSRGMALMTIEQLCDIASGERAVTGKALLVVRDVVPGETVAAAPAANKPAKEREGEPPCRARLHRTGRSPRAPGGHRVAPRARRPAPGTGAPGVATAGGEPSGLNR